MLGAVVQNVVTLATRRPGFVYPCSLISVYWHCLYANWKWMSNWHKVECLTDWMVGLAVPKVAIVGNKKRREVNCENEKEDIIYMIWYTGCPKRKGQNFGREFLMLKYTDITQNTYIQSWTVTEIMAREVWNFDSCYTLIDYQIHIKTGRNMWFL